MSAINDPHKYEAHLGVLPTAKDIEKIAEIFIKDICQFDTENPDLKLIKKKFYLTGKQITSYTLFTLARSRLLPDTYNQHIDISHHENSFYYYSVPFLLRLAIENKLKAMVGFKSSENQIGKKREITEEFPTSVIINFLCSKPEFIESPMLFENLKNIYKWACGFTHTGKKEYIWMLLKAVSSLNKLFSKDYSPGYGSRISYLKPGVQLNDLQKAINDYIKERKWPKTRTLELSEDEFDDTDGFWDNRRSQNT